MKVIDRIIFIIVGLLFAAVGAGIILLALNVLPMSEVRLFIQNLDMQNMVTALLALAVGLVFIVVAVKILFVRPKKDKINSFVIFKSEDGEASVSVTAIENTVKLAIAKYDDVKDSKIRIRVMNAGIVIYAKLAIPTGVFLPELLDEVKKYLKEFTEQHTGATVLSVKILATEYKSVDPAAEKKKMAAEKKNEEKRIADEKKAEEKRIADEKKAEEKRIAEEKKAEENLVVEETIEEEVMPEPEIKKTETVKPEAGYAIAPARSPLQDDVDIEEFITAPVIEAETITEEAVQAEPEAEMNAEETKDE